MKRSEPESERIDRATAEFPNSVAAEWYGELRPLAPSACWLT